MYSKTSTHSGFTTSTLKASCLKCSLTRWSRAWRVPDTLGQQTWINLESGENHATQRHKQNGAQRTAGIENTTERNKVIIPIKRMELPDESHLPKGETDSSPALAARAEVGRQDLKLMDKATEMEIPSSLPPSIY